MSRACFRLNLHFTLARISTNSLLKAGAKSEIWVTASGLKLRITYFVNEHLTIWTSWPNNWAAFWVLICTVHLTISSCHVTCTFQSESTLYNFLNIKDPFAQSIGEIWSLSYCNWTRIQNHLVCKGKLNHLAKPAKWLSCALSTYLHGAFDCMFLPCHVRVSEWIHILSLPECQGSLCSKKGRKLKFQWLQLDPNPESLSS